MRLMIHYNVDYEGTREELIEKLQALRHFCLDLPFAKVGKVISTEATKEHIDAFIDMQSCRQAGGSGEHEPNVPEQPFKEIEAIIDYIIKQPVPTNKIKPASSISFKLWAGEGCEFTTFTFKQKKVELPGFYKNAICVGVCKVPFTCNQGFRIS